MTDLEGGAWQRVHPATPFVRGWGALLVGFGVVVQGFGTGPGFDADIDEFVRLPMQVLIVLAIAVLVLLGNVVSWWVTAYRIDADAVQLRSGLFSRSMRQARLDRVQAVDVVQPLVGRLVGLSELRIEVAGGTGSDVRLAYLRDAEAHRLRNALLAAAAGVSYDTDEAPEAEETAILAVPVPRLIAGILLSGGGIFAGLVLVGLLVAATTGSIAALAGTFPVVLGAGGFLASQFTRGFNFRLASSDDGVRVRAGLTETRAATIPPGRVQAIEVSQSLLWRPRDWWRVRVNIAGYGADDASQRTVMLPIGTRTDALWVLRILVPDIGTDDPLPVLDSGLTGRGDPHGFVTSPRRARWLDPLSWRRNGYAATRTVLLSRSGVLTRVLVVVPHQRTQSIGLQQGPLQRSFGVATVALHSTPGPITPVLRHLAVAEAARVVDEQSSRASRARAGDDPPQWLDPAGAAVLNSEDSPRPD